jgi:hypothetical protein
LRYYCTHVLSYNGDFLFFFSEKKITKVKE